MRWGNLRSWWVISGLVLVVAALTAVPVMVKSQRIGGPSWLLPAIAVVAGVLLTVWKPILTARSGALTARVADAGDTLAMVVLGFILHTQGDLDGARTWYTRAANASNTDAVSALAELPTIEPCRVRRPTSGGRHPRTSMWVRTAWGSVGRLTA
jgi:hypothetical protein